LNTVRRFLTNQLVNLSHQIVALCRYVKGIIIWLASLVSVQPDLSFYYPCIQNNPANETEIQRNANSDAGSNESTTGFYYANTIRGKINSEKNKGRLY
jgi:hypothetical protein